MQFKIYTIHVTSQSLVCVITPTLLRASHPLFVWHHNRHMYSILCTMGDIASSLYEIKPPFLWHHTHSIWHCINAISFTTSTVLMISHQLYLRDLIFYICRHHIFVLYTTTYSLYLYHHSHCSCFSHPHFPWYHTICVYDVARTICLTLDTLYKVSHPQFMTSCHIIYEITGTVFISSLPLYLTLHPQYLCPHNPSNYDFWTTVCMTSHPLYI